MNASQIEKLRQFYRADDAAKAVLDTFANRRKQVRYVAVHRLEHATGLDRWEVVRVLKALQTLGVGDFVVGRKGHVSRFVFGELSVTSVGQAAAGEVDEIDSVDEAELSEDDEASDWLPLSEEGAGETHAFVLRPSFKIELPTDLTRQEADRLTAFIQAVVSN